MVRPLIITLCLGASVCFARAAEAACGPAPKVEEPSAEAKQAYETALDLSKDGRFGEALAAYQRAYDLSPSYVILYNLGKAAALSGDAARAYHAYACHLEHGGSAVDPTRRSEVEAEMRRLRGEVGLLDVTVDEPGAHVELDGVDVGTVPLSEPVLVNPGKRLVRVKGSASAKSQAVEVQRGGRVVVEFQLHAEAPKGKAFRFPNAVVGAAWVFTGLFGVSTAVTGSLALVISSDIEDEVYLGPSRTPPAGSPLADKVSSARALATSSDVLLTLLCVTGSAAISFSVVNATASDDPERQGRLEDLRLHLAPGGVVLTGAF